MVWFGIPWGPNQRWCVLEMAVDVVKNLHEKCDASIQVGWSYA